MSDDDSSGVHIFVPRTLLGVAGAGLLSLGVGGGIAFSPQINQVALEQCFDNSQTALSVAAQHGEEFVEVRRRLSQLESRGYTIEQYEDDRDDHQREHNLIDRRIDLLEK